jgi:hypothetical protein
MKENFIFSILIKRFICIVDNQISIIEEMQLKKQETKKKSLDRPLFICIILIISVSKLLAIEKEKKNFEIKK